MMASLSAQSPSQSRESFLDKKIFMMDKRLTLIEKFVESRFKEAFQNFVTSDKNNDTWAEQNTSDLAFERSKASTSKSGSRAKGKSGSKIKKMKVEKIQQKQDDPFDDASEADGAAVGRLHEDITKIPRYNTRSKGSDKGDPQSQESQPTLILAENVQQLMDRDDVDDTRFESTDYLSNSYHAEAEGTFNSESYIEFPETGDSNVESKLDLRGSEAQTSADNSNTKTSGTKSGRKRKSTSSKPVEAEEYMSFVEESPNTPKKRVYAPASCSTLPSIARAAPTRKECPKCHMHIKNEHFDAHVNSHVKERHLKCQFCEKTYFNQSMLRKHRMIHQPEKYGKKCRVCEKMFFHGDKKLAHERFCAKRAVERKEYVDPEIIQDIQSRSPGWTAEPEPVSYSDPLELKECPHCNKMFKANFYQRHLKVHTVTKDWACKSCEKAYYHKHDLVRHFAAEHRSPVCDLCSKTFKKKSELNSHVAGCRRRHKASKSKSKRGDTNLTNLNVMPMDIMQGDAPPLPTTTSISMQSTSSGPLLVAGHSLESNPSFIENGTTVTILNEELIVVASDIEVSQLDGQPHSIFLVEDQHV